MKVNILNYDSASCDAIDLSISEFRDERYEQIYDQTGEKPEIDFLVVEVTEETLQSIGNPQKVYFAKHSPNVLVGEKGRTTEFTIIQVKYYYQ